LNQETSEEIDSIIFDTSLGTSIYRDLMKKLDIKLELVTYWDPCKGRSLYKSKSNWLLEQKFNCILVFWDSPG